MKIVNLITLLFLTAIITNNAYAKDIAKGTIELSGDSSFSISSSESTQQGVSGSEDTDTRTLNLSALYYVAPNVGVGILWFNANEETNDGIDKDEISINSLGPTVGYNMSIDAASSFQFFAGLLLIGDYEAQSNGFTISEGDVSGHVFGATYKKFITESVSFNAGFSMSTIEIEEDGGSDVETDSTDLDFGLSVYF